MDQRLLRFGLFAVIVVVVAGLVLYLLLQPKSQPVLIEDALTPIPSPEPTSTPRPFRIYVSGAVQEPDVYELPWDSIVKDAVLAAGGATDEADLDRINLAQPLMDGEHIYVPHAGEESLPVEPASRQPAALGKVNINTASSAELETLPGIGPVTAQRILDHRQANGPFAQIESIMDVKGIGPATFEGMKDLITTQ
jgi:competence protein ComEA